MKRCFLTYDPLAGVHSRRGKRLLIKKKSPYSFFLVSLLLRPRSSASLRLNQRNSGWTRFRRHFSFLTLSFNSFFWLPLDRKTCRRKRPRLRKSACCRFRGSWTLSTRSFLQACSSFSFILHRHIDFDAGLSSPVAPFTPVTRGERHLSINSHLFDRSFLLWQVRATRPTPCRRFRILRHLRLSRRSWPFCKAPSSRFDFNSDDLWFLPLWTGPCVTPLSPVPSVTDSESDGEGPSTPQPVKPPRPGPRCVWRRQFWRKKTASQKSKKTEVKEGRLFVFQRTYLKPCLAKSPFVRPPTRPASDSPMMFSRVRSGRFCNAVSLPLRCWFGFHYKEWWYMCHWNTHWNMKGRKSLQMRWLPMLFLFLFISVDSVFLTKNGDMCAVETWQAVRAFRQWLTMLFLSSFLMLIPFCLVKNNVATAFSRDWTCVIETWKVVRAFKWRGWQCCFSSFSKLHGTGPLAPQEPCVIETWEAVRAFKCWP